MTSGYAALSLALCLNLSLHYSLDQTPLFHCSRPHHASSSVAISSFLPSGLHSLSFLASILFFLLLFLTIKHINISLLYIPFQFRCLCKNQGVENSGDYPVMHNTVWPCWCRKQNRANEQIFIADIFALSPFWALWHLFKQDHLHRIKIGLFYYLIFLSSVSLDESKLILNIFC